MSQSNFLNDFHTNPHLAVRKLMTPADPAATSERLPERAPGCRRPAEQRHLPGDIRIRRNTTSKASAASLDAGPTRAQLASLLTAEALTHRLLELGGLHTLDAQADAIQHFMDSLAREYAPRGLEKRGVVVAEAAARYAVTYTQPVELRFLPLGKARRWYLDDTEHEAVPDGGEHSISFDTGAGRELLQRERILWSAPDGPGNGLLIDRFHHTHLNGVIERDTWTRRKVAQDLQRAAAFLRGAPGYDPHAIKGVRVLTHQAPNVGLHFLPDFTHDSATPIVGRHHRLGECDDCASRVIHPQPTPFEARSDQSGGL